jgi:hypothetical protein
MRAELVVCQLSRPEAGQLEPGKPQRLGREVDDEHTSRPEAIAGGVRHDVGHSEHEDLAVIDGRVRPVANEPIARRDRPFSVNHDAGIVEVVSLRLAVLVVGGSLGGASPSFRAPNELVSRRYCYLGSSRK